MTARSQYLSALEPRLRLPLLAAGVVHYALHGRAEASSVAPAPATGGGLVTYAGHF